MTEISRKQTAYSHLQPTLPAQTLLMSKAPASQERGAVRSHTYFAVLSVALALVVPSTPAHAQFRYPPMYPYPYPGYRTGVGESDLRLKVKPKEASVYIDGYLAGRVEEYDGTFERLHVEPGQHEVIVYLEGYRSLRQRLYLSPNATRKIEGELEKRAPGDPGEPVPQPTVQPARPGPATNRQSPIVGRGTRRPPPPSAPQPPAADSDRDRSGSPGSSRFGTISIAVQPSGATVFVDGEKWTGPAGRDERLIIQVEQGHHRIEVERNGYERFVTEIDVRGGDTAPLDVSLTRSR